MKKHMLLALVAVVAAQGLLLAWHLAWHIALHSGLQVYGWPRVVVVDNPSPSWGATVGLMLGFIGSGIWAFAVWRAQLSNAADSR